LKRHAKDGALIRAHKEVLKMLVIKRTGDTQEFDEEKIKAAVAKAMSRTDYEDDKLQKKVVRYVEKNVTKGEDIDIDSLHELVENGIMKAQAFDVAREYVTYRKDNMPDIFRERIAYKPFEYPNLAEYVDAIQQSYWIVSEFNFTSDVQDFKATMQHNEVEAAKRSMLAISQVEVAVKTFWGNVGDRLKKAEIQEVGATFGESECFSDDTEVLTQDGWRLFEELRQEGGRVAQYNMVNSTVSFVEPSQHVKKHHEGKMHLYQSKGTDICVTPNHDILVMHPQKDYYEKRKSEDGIWEGDYSYPASGHKKGGRVFTDVERLLIGTQVEELPDEVSSGIEDFGFVSLDEVGGDYCEAFFDELQRWSVTTKGGSFTYYNASEAAVDKIMAMAALGGFSVNADMNNTKSSYDVHITKSGKKVYPKRKEIDYSGYVYCVTVPEGNIITRRGKRVAITGNCRHSRAYSHLLEVLGLNGEFEEVLEVPAIKNRVAYAQKALSKAKTDSNKDYVESILLFTLFIENVSLFSQFLILSQMNKEKGVLSGLSNVIAATSLEEQLHNDFGCELVNIIRKENPSWFDEDLNERVSLLVHEAFDAERDVIKWIYEEGELSYLTEEEAIEYIKNRFNTGLGQAGFKKEFEIDPKLLERTEWFDLQNVSTMHTDFFAKRPNTYTKFSKSFDEDDLF